MPGHSVDLHHAVFQCLSQQSKLPDYYTIICKHCCSNLEFKSVQTDEDLLQRRPVLLAYHMQAMSQVKRHVHPAMAAYTAPQQMYIRQRRTSQGGAGNNEMRSKQEIYRALTVACSLDMALAWKLSKFFMASSWFPAP
jgi:hypothetical protein